MDRNSDDGGATKCVACDAGRYSGPGPAQKECQLCIRGMYSATKAELCDACAPGQTTDPAGQDAETNLVLATHITNCTNCSAGKRWVYPNTTLAKDANNPCLDCEAGKFNPVANGRVNCTFCGVGKWSSPEATQCTSCEPGRFVANIETPDRCVDCEAGKGHGDTGANSSGSCISCNVGFFFNPEDHPGVVTLNEKVHPVLKSCRACDIGQHTYDHGGTVCTACAGDDAAPDNLIRCLGGNCREGHANKKGSFCGSCVSIEEDYVTKIKQFIQYGDKTRTRGYLDEDNWAFCQDSTNGDYSDCPTTGYRDGKPGWFAKGTECLPCTDPLLLIVMASSAVFIGTFILTYSVVKGLSADDVGRAEGGLDFAGAMTSVFGMLQRLSAILTLPFGWPRWLVDIMYYLKGVVAFDVPGLVAPECQTEQTPTQMQLTRLIIGATCLPAVWTIIGVEMLLIRFCTKMGRRKAKRGLSLFGCGVFSKCGCQAGALQTVVVTTHGLFFLGIMIQAFAALYCIPVNVAKFEQQDALALNPAVLCTTDTEVNADGSVYAGLVSLAYNMIIVFGLIMGLMHWSDKVEYLGLWNKALVAAICIFFSREQDAMTALAILSAVSLFFAVIARHWANKLDEDNDDSNDAEADNFRATEVGAYCELWTFVCGMLLVSKTVEEGSTVSNMLAYSILFVMFTYTMWVTRMGIHDEIRARRAEKAAVAHILFQQMDVDGSGTLDIEELGALCERLGKKISDKEITKAMKQMDKDGSMEADANEFVTWWVEHGGRKVPIPDELMDLADHAGAGRVVIKGCPFHSPEDFAIDDEVRWFKSDDDVPTGVVGHVVGFKHKTNRVYVAWPGGKFFAMEASELLLFSQATEQEAMELAAAEVAQQKVRRTTQLKIMTSKSDKECEEMLKAAAQKATELQETADQMRTAAKDAAEVAKHEAVEASREVNKNADEETQTKQAGVAYLAGEEEGNKIIAAAEDNIKLFEAQAEDARADGNKAVGLIRAQAEQDLARLMNEQAAQESELLESQEKEPGFVPLGTDFIIGDHVTWQQDDDESSIKNGVDGFFEIKQPKNASNKGPMTKKEKKAAAKAAKKEKKQAKSHKDDECEDGSTEPGSPKKTVKRAQVPRGAIGTVIDFTKTMQAEVVFSCRPETFVVPRRALKLMVAHADNSAVDRYKHTTVAHVALLEEQTQADEDYDVLLKQLESMSEKELKTRLQKLYPGSKAHKINKKHGNGMDDRDKDNHESKKDWRHRILVEHSVEYAAEDKRQADERRAIQIAKAVKEKDEAEFDIKHIEHFNEVGIHNARVKHAETMHTESIEQHAKALKRLKSKNTWKVKGMGKPVDLLQEEAKERGIDHVTSGHGKRHVRKELIKHEKEQGPLRQAAAEQAIAAEKQRQLAREEDFHSFAEMHGIDKTEPPQALFEMAQLPDIPVDGPPQGVTEIEEKKRRREKKKKEAAKKQKNRKTEKTEKNHRSDEVEFDEVEFANPLASET